MNTVLKVFLCFNLLTSLFCLCPLAFPLMAVALRQFEMIALGEEAPSSMAPFATCCLIFFNLTSCCGSYFPASWTSCNLGYKHCLFKRSRPTNYGTLNHLDCRPHVESISLSKALFSFFSALDCFQNFEFMPLFGDLAESR